MTLKRIVTLLPLLCACTPLIAQVFESKQTLYSGSSYGGYYTESVFSAIDSHDGDIYFVMIDPNRRPMVGKIADGTTDVQPLTSEYADYVTRDDGHHELSIGVDADGYIHIAGDMHNHPQMDTDHMTGDAAPLRDANIMYWKSDAPGDISSFSFIGFDDDHRIPGKAFSYGHFFTDRNGVLFYSARTLARSYYYQKPQNDGVGRGLGLYVYDTNSKSWTARGVLPDMYGFTDANHKVIVYDPSGHSGNTSYQQYKGDFYFDDTNRMHMALGMNTDGHTDVNNVIYAYSDDLGQTFHKANGDPITLPMTADDGPYQADLLVTNSTSGVDMDQASVVAAWNNYPVVHYLQNGGYFKYWDGSSWSAAQSAPTSPRDEILFNEHTDQLLFIDIHSGTIHARNSINGSDEEYDAGPRFQYYDIKTFRSQNVLNGISWESSGSSGAYNVIQLVGEEVDPPLDCNNEAGGSAYVDDCGECVGGSTGNLPNTTCEQDCNNEWGGTAYVDDCAVCVEGSTGLAPNLCIQDPYGGSAHIIPGTIEAEQYDIGANGYAYNDVSAGNTGAEFRDDDVDIEIAETIDGTYNVGWVEDGEWLEYTVNVTQSGPYDFAFRTATANGGDGFSVMMDGQEIIPVTLVPATAGWQDYNLVIVPGVVLEAGEQIMRLNFHGSGMNFDRIDISNTLITGTNFHEGGQLIEVFPNPATSGVTLKLANTHVGTWTLINSSGAEVQTGQLSEGQTVIPLASDWQGLHVLRYDTGKGHYSVKVVIAQ